MARRSGPSRILKSVDIDMVQPAKRTKNTNGTGTSKSALATKNNRDAIQSGVLTVETADPAKLARWKAKLVSTDPKVQFHPTDLLEVRHSVCGEYVRMGAMYKAARWNLHLKSNCPVLHPENRKREGKGKHQNVERWPTRGASKAPVLTTNTAIPHLPTYLQRTGAAGGSGRSLTWIAKQKFGKLFGLLSIKDKKDVTDTQLHEHRWRNDHSNFEFSAVLALKNFKEAVRRPTPDDKHYIYVNDKYRNQLLGHIYARAIGLKESLKPPIVGRGPHDRSIMVLGYKISRCKQSEKPRPSLGPRVAISIVVEHFRKKSAQM
ncbi:hypothetical protein B0H14DRAFT_2575363 [Mycena olivaceomarginata]|nr:hypothetical protein B0H14DRAFT_2575363 [Mycena olivaceomarginata]